jgi:hypothetical protein
MSTVLTGVRLRLVSNQEHYFETPKSSASEQTISASMGNFSGVVGSLAIGRRGRGGEVIRRYAATLFRILILRKPANIGGAFSWTMPKDNPSF